ncbi:hypothetical protein EDC04DRAFT_2557393 [Pisolithus marmoratus]|nr:hypothetical protein EDC04DRAFT_2557393 [Pisolithus marmoratus]
MYLTSPAKAAEGSTPTPSFHSSRPSFDNLVDMTESMLKEPPQDHQTAKNYVCINPLNFQPRRGGGSAHTLLTSQWNHHFITRLNCCRQVWFTKQYVLHFLLFSGISSQGRPNEYRLEAIYDSFILRYPKYVTFSTPDPKKLPLPSPMYLAIHAACAKVAHLSGAAQYIADIFRHMEDILVLAGMEGRQSFCTQRSFPQCASFQPRVTGIHVIKLCYYVYRASY